jgi:shikimate dehydrogenase
MIDLNGQTSLYGIIGDPVTHSLSPLFQNYFINTAKLDAAYLPFPVKPSCLKQAIAGLHAANIHGLNVTIPHKEAILTMVDADKDALTIGAVNTLKHMGTGKWKATNTDWQGFAAVLQGLEADVSQSPVLLFGAGGTARAICHALQHQGAKDVYLCNRSPERAGKLADELNLVYPNMEIHTLTWDAALVSKQLQNCSVAINSSSVGLDESDTFPFEIHGEGFAIDAVYKPHGHTAFCKAASTRITVDGLPMLIAQGIASFAFWHHEQLQKQSFVLPKKQESLQWVEQNLSRKTLNLPGWRT